MARVEELQQFTQSGACFSSCATSTQPSPKSKLHRHQRGGSPRDDSQILGPVLPPERAAPPHDVLARGCPPGLLHNTLRSSRQHPSPTSPHLAAMADRPGRLHTSKSFTRLESDKTKTPSSRSRASTLQGPPMPAITDPLKITATPEEEDGHADGDVFASKEGDEEEADPELNVPDGFEELPIEIRSLTERWDSCPQ